MPHLTEIPGIGAASRKLLEAAGIVDSKDLARQNAVSLVAKMEKANKTLEIVKRVPRNATVEKWISSAAEVKASTADGSVEPAQTSPVNYEGSEEVVTMLAAAPFAIPFPGKQMMEKGLGVGDIPAGLLLNRYSGDLEIRIGDSSSPGADVPVRRSSSSSEQISAQAPQRRFDASQVRVISPDGDQGTVRMPKTNDPNERDRVALIRAPREATNRGKDPKSRRYIRGVLHTHPWSLRLGAVFSLLLLINLPLAIASAFLLLLSREYPEMFSWVPTWCLAFPFALPVIGFAYLIWGASGKCRICTQKLFVHKGALKHAKAHFFLGLGFVVPLCLHLLCFSWFRCSSCGTPVRLKK